MCHRAVAWTCDVTDIGHGAEGVNLYLEKSLFNKLSNKYLMRISKFLHFEHTEENLLN